MGLRIVFDQDLPCLHKSRFSSTCFGDTLASHVGVARPEMKRRVRQVCCATSCMLRLARARALAHGVRVRVALAGTPPIATVFEGVTPIGSWQLPRVTILSGPASGFLIFTPLGTAPNATITLGAGTRVRSVIVNQRGRVRVG